MSWINLAVGAAKGITAIGQGNASDITARAQAGMLDYQAKVETDIAMNTAALIRRAGVSQASSANASYAAAGVKVGEGSSLETERQIYQDSQHDAFQAILEGQRRAIGLKTDAEMMRINGKLQKTAGYVNALSAMASSAYQGYAGWKTRQDLASADAQYSYNNDASGSQFSMTGEQIRGRR